MLELPGSKSVTNRALVLAALSPGPALLRRPLRSRDTLLMAAGLRTLGVSIVEETPAGAPTWQVGGQPGPLRPVGDLVDVGNAGTVARFLPAVATLARGDVRFDGDPRVRQRPLGPLLAALRTLGAVVDDGGRAALPITVHGSGRLPGGTVEIDASSSSQLVSGLLLAAPRFDRGVTVRHVGPPLPSAPHLAMTVAMLRSAGAVVDDATMDRWTVAAGPLAARDWDIEPDLSTAAPFLAAALVTGGRVRVPGWPARTTQPGAALPQLLQRMGADSALDRGGLTVRGSGEIRGIDADLRDCGELTPVLAALAALATGRSVLRGVAHLRLQETDRLAALAREISGLGGDVRETADGLQIAPRPLHGGHFATYDDHRMAMAGALLGLAVPGVLVADVATTGKTVPDFVGLWTRLLGSDGLGTPTGAPV